MSEFTVEVPFEDLTPAKARSMMMSDIQEIKKGLATLSDEVQQLKDAVEAESVEDRLTAEQIAAKDAKIDELNGRLDEADQFVTQAKEDVAAAKGGESAALDRLEVVLQAIRDAVEKLREDDPVPDNTLPGAGSEGGAHPDNTLPGSGGGMPGEHPDNTLPGPGSEGGAYPDISGPGEQPYPDQTLPGDLPPDQPQINPLKGRRRA